MQYHGKEYQGREYQGIWGGCEGAGDWVWTPDVEPAVVLPGVRPSVLLDLERGIAELRDID